MAKIPNNEKQRERIQQLLDQNYYIGNLSSRGFIIKRNFGIRRLPLYGKFEKDTIQIEIKNEFVHQVFYIFGILLFIVLIVFALYQTNYLMAGMVSIILVLLLLDDYHRKNKELKIFLEKIKEV
ncbi:hypothetical protein GO491_09405 [Flavobacteriaceae bacterium Ap0902]|nr:hypothetical protein [Flavobacteriaceae bacterium Ap0902]